MRGENCVPASLGAIGRGPVGVREIRIVAGNLNHAVERHVLDDLECSHVSLRFRGWRPYSLGIARNSRTSTGARHATTALRPHATASSMLPASSIQKPPICSLVSRYGPSVTTACPTDVLRSDFARGADCRPPAKTLAPAAAISLLSTSISRTISSLSVDAS